MEFLLKNLFWLALAIVSGVLLIFGWLRNRGLSLTVPQATLLINREDALLLDVRESSEWETGHLPNARHITLGQLVERISEIEKYKDQTIIVYCASGARALDACGKLRKRGFSKAHVLAGGIQAWKDAQLPLTSKR